MPEARQGFNFSFRCVLQRFGRFDSSRAAAEDAARASLALSLILRHLWGFWPQKKYQRTPQRSVWQHSSVPDPGGMFSTSLGLQAQPRPIPTPKVLQDPTSPPRPFAGSSPSPSPSFSGNLRHLALPTPSLAHEEPQEPREAAPAPARGIGRDLNESRARLAIKEVQTPL